VQLDAPLLKINGAKFIIHHMAAVRLGGAWKLKEQEQQRLQEKLRDYERMHFDLQSRLSEQEIALIQTQAENERLNDLHIKNNKLNAVLSGDTKRQQTTIETLSATTSAKEAEAELLQGELNTIRAALESERAARVANEELLDTVTKRDALAQEEATELQDLLYKSHEVTEKLEEQLKKQNRCFSLMEAAKKQKDRHVCVLVKEKERLHRRVEELQRSPGVARRRAPTTTPPKSQNEDPPQQKWASPCSVASPLSAKKLPYRPMSPGSNASEQEMFLLNMVRKLKAKMQRQQDREGKLQSTIEKMKLENANLVSRYRNRHHASAAATRAAGSR
jgi:hypothetical protein